MAHERDGDTSYNWCTWNNSLKIRKGTGRFGNNMISGVHFEYIFIKISQNTEKSPEVLRRLAVTQIPVKSHHPTLV